MIYSIYRYVFCYLHHQFARYFNRITAGVGMSAYTTLPENKLSNEEITDNTDRKENGGSKKGWRHPTIVEISCVVYTACFFCLPALLPLYVKHRVERDVFSGVYRSYLMRREVGNLNQTEQEMEHEVQTMSARFVIYLTVSRAIPATLTTVIIMPYTDIIGRKVSK